ncbi:MAG: Crp/Fnr family transcriptional regulator [Bacteroidetes bacterium]|nr:MAG: Crp/Fnr family transcriptional regulator [Bacteroidota bacterium]
MNKHEAFALLESSWKGKYPFEEEELQQLKALFDFVQFKRKDFLIKEGMQEHGIYFIAEGILRAYFENEEQEITAAFIYSGYWSSSFASFLSGVPSDYNVEVLEDVSALYLNKEKLERALQASEQFALYYRRLLENVVVGMQFRERELLASTAEQRFERFMKQSAFLTQRLPLKHIASYLSMTPETFSRLRRKWMEK